MNAAPSLTASAGAATSPAPDSPRPPALPNRDAAWSKVLVEAEDGPGGMADWTASEDAPMQGLTASGDTIMRQSAVAMTIGLVAPVIASASVQATYGTPMPAASVKHPDTATGKTAGAVRTATPQHALEAAKRDAPAPAASPQAGSTGQGAAPAAAQMATPIAALKALVQAQLGSAVTVATSAAATLPQANASSGPRAPGRTPVEPGPVTPGSVTPSPAAPSNDLVALPPMPGHGGIVQLTGLDLSAGARDAAESVLVDDLVPQAPSANRSGIVQLTGQEESVATAEPEETVPAEPVPDLPHVAGTVEAETREPVRLHAEWSEAGVKVWLGTDADQLPNLPVLAQQVQQWLTGQGERLISLVCNGQDITTEAEAGLDFASQSGEGWAERPLPRPAGLSDHS